MEIGVTLTVFGMDLGHFYGNLTEGLVIKLNLVVINGEIQLYLQNLKDVWIKVDVNVLGIGRIYVNQKILSL